MINFTAKTLKKNMLLSLIYSAFLSLTIGTNESLGMEEISKRSEETSTSSSRGIKIEAFLEKDLDRLGASTKADRIINNKEINVNVFTADEKYYNEIFPIHELNFDLSSHVNDGSFFAGQLVYTKDEFGFGTGTLLKIEEKEGKLIASGISALHNFVNYDKKHGYNTSTRGSISFLQGNFRLGKIVLNIGVIPIDEVIINVKDEIDDICLFKGEIKLNEDLLNDIKNSRSSSEGSSSEELPMHKYYLSIFNQNTLSFLDEVTITNKINAHMYHYPLGINDLRKTSGSVTHNNRHEINSFEGSSGASILQIINDRLKIIGVHDGYYRIDENKDSVVDVKIPTEIFENLPVAKYNSYVSINDEYYKQFFTNGHNIISSRPTNIDISLKKFTENIKITEKLN